MCRTRDRTNQCTFNSLPLAAASSRLYLVSNMCYLYSMGWSANHWDLDQFALSALLLQAVNSNSAWQRSIIFLPDHFVRVLFRPHWQERCILDHRWTNHVARGRIDGMRKPLRSGCDYCLVYIFVYRQAHVDVWHIISFPHTSELSLCIGSYRISHPPDWYPFPCHTSETIATSEK